MAEVTTKKVLLVGDYGQDDLAFKEVQQKLYALAQKAGEHIEVDIISVPAFDTARTAAVVAQAAEDGRYDVIYHNTAPRKDVTKARTNNAGEGLAYTNYTNAAGKKVGVIGVNAGTADSLNTFALLSDEGYGEVLEVDCAKNGSQFRSRDVFPPSVIDAVKGEVKTLGKASGTEPFYATERQEGDFVQGLFAEAQIKLSAVYEGQFSRHGDASKGYVTLVGKNPLYPAMDALAARLGDAPEIDAIPVKFNTENSWVEAGFVAAQLALTSTYPQQRTLVVLTGEGVNKPEDAKELYHATLNNGATIVTDDIRALAFAAQNLVGEVTRYGTEARTLSTGANGQIMVAGKDTQPIPASQAALMAALPEGIVPAYIDGYGNMKLATRHKALLEQLEIGDDAFAENNRGVLRATFGENAPQIAFVAGGSFSVADGEMALSRGSSGWNTPLIEAGGDPRMYFAEIFLRGGNAAEALGNPKPGQAVEIESLGVVKGNDPSAIARVTAAHPAIEPKRAVGL